MKVTTTKISYFIFHLIGLRDALVFLHKVRIIPWATWSLHIIPIFHVNTGLIWAPISRFFLTMLAFGEEGYFSISWHNPFFSCLLWWVPTYLLVAQKEGWITCRSLFSSCLGLTSQLFLLLKCICWALPKCKASSNTFTCSTSLNYHNSRGHHHGAQTLWHRDRHSKS